MAVAELHVPERSLVQRMKALDRANEIRSVRAATKRDLKRGEVRGVDLLLEPPDEFDSMKVFDLLLALPKVGRVKANKILGVTRISPTKTVGGLTDRQRRELAALLRRR